MKTIDIDTTPLTLDDSTIRELQHEAASAGDTAMVLTCRTACGDHEEASPAEVMAARKTCLHALRDAAAATMAIETRDGVEIEVGDWVVAGEGSDRDCGRVSSIVKDVVRVHWQSGVETPCDVTSVEAVYTSRPESW